MLLAEVHESVVGTKRTWRRFSVTSAFDAVDGSSTGTGVPWMCANRVSTRSPL
jgi:hypothetical protein